MVSEMSEDKTTSSSNPAAASSSPQPSPSSSSTKTVPNNKSQTFSLFSQVSLTHTQQRQSPELCLCVTVVTFSSSSCRETATPWAANQKSEREGRHTLWCVWRRKRWRERDGERERIKLTGDMHSGVSSYKHTLQLSLVWVSMCCCVWRLYEVHVGLPNPNGPDAKLTLTGSDPASEGGDSLVPSAGFPEDALR